MRWRPGPEEYPLPDNCRDARPIHDLAYRFYDGTLPAEAVREDGREPLIVEAEGPEATVDAVRASLHDLVHVEKVDRGQIVVLTGVSLEHSATWRQRRFKGDLVLWNGGVDDAGRSKGCSADKVPDQPRARSCARASTASRASSATSWCWRRSGPTTSAWSG